MYNFYAMMEFGRDFSNQNQDLFTSGKTLGYRQGSKRSSEHYIWLLLLFPIPLSKNALRKQM